MMIHAYAAKEKGATLTPFEYEAAPLGPFDIALKITHCGICYSDVHMIDNDWKISSYPLVPGHEIVGEVVDKGAHIPHLRIGQRVGVGWQRSACLHCRYCLGGLDNLCGERDPTIVGHHGGFADYMHTDGRFAFPLPEGLPSAGAAPLLCGGGTVYAPLKNYGVRPSMRVGVVGIGGLGHLAVQFAAKMGCYVVAFSHSKDKMEEAQRLGAREFIATSDRAALEGAAGSLDFLFSTIDRNLDWKTFLPLLRLNGKMCFVGVPAKDCELPAGPMVFNQLSLGGSSIASRATITEMLEFAERHEIAAQVEVRPLKEVNEALTHLRAGKARYRMVLEM